MMELKGFIEVHCLADDLKVAIRCDCISLVYDVGEENDDGAIRPAHTMIQVSNGDAIRVREDYAEVLGMIWKSEL